jgi:hypothetical protein
MKKSFEPIAKWLKKSGSKVNQENPDLCLFYKHDTTPVNVTLGNSVIKYIREIMVLGVLFD